MHKSQYRNIRNIKAIWPLQKLIMLQ
jgi:hypothetical protein